jgi:predicted nucleic acid-binding protein
MSDFVDTCILIAYKYRGHKHHDICENFIGKRIKKIVITKGIEREFIYTIQRKLTLALTHVLSKTRKLKFEEDVYNNIELVKEVFDELKKRYSELKIFWDDLESTSINFLKKGAKDLQVLTDWALEEIRNIQDDLEKLIGMKREDYPAVKSDIKLEEKDEIKGVIASEGIHFKDDWDEAIFYEVIVNRYNRLPLTFYSIDKEFVKKANIAVNKLMKKGTIERNKIKFVYLPEQKT